MVLEGGEDSGQVAEGELFRHPVRLGKRPPIVAPFTVWLSGVAQRSLAPNLEDGGVSWCPWGGVWLTTEWVAGVRRVMYLLV